MIAAPRSLQSKRLQHDSWAQTLHTLTGSSAMKVAWTLEDLTALAVKVSVNPVDTLVLLAVQGTLIVRFYGSTITHLQKAVGLDVNKYGLVKTGGNKLSSLR